MAKKKRKQVKVPMNGRTFVCARGHAMQATVAGVVWLEQDGVDFVRVYGASDESELRVYCEADCKRIGRNIKKAFTKFLEGVLY